MKKVGLLVLIIIMSSTSVRAQFLQVDPTKFIEWSDTLYLKWSDYEYRPEKAPKRGSMALTSVFHSVRGGIEDGKPNFQVKVFLVKDDSWTSDTLNLPLLAHEKLHFDLAELYGRKIRKEIEILGKRKVTDLSEYKRYIKFLLNDFKNVSLAYDKETEHGRKPQSQEKWLSFVLSEMQRLHEYM